jgi:D-arginine dehydrogenase
MTDCDIAIFGAGIAGASLAWRLADHGRVQLLEREPQPGYHSTGRSAALFLESYGPPAVRAMTRASRAFYEHPPAGFTDSPLIKPRGALYLATLGQAALLDQLRQDLAPTCPGLVTLDAAQILARVPCLRADQVLAGLYDASAEDMDVHAIHQGFLRGFLQRGKAAGSALRTNAHLTSARHDGHHWQLQFADGQTLQATTVVNAAGAWADELGALLGARPIGLLPHRRSAFTFKLPDGLVGADWPAVIGVDESYYFKPDAGHMLGSPANADPTTPHDVQPEELDIAQGIAQIEAVTHFSIRRPASTWAGLRSFVPDGEMVIGHDADTPGLFWLAAQGGYGIQSAVGASALADALLRRVALPAELVQEGLDPSVLSPDRLSRVARSADMS